MVKPVGDQRDDGGIVLLTGATGYIGRHLLPLLQQRRETVRCLVRRPDAIRGAVGAHVELCQGDALDAESLAKAMNGVDTAYYLIHSMGCGGDFESLDRLAARNFAGAALDAGVRRIVYLGGLAEDGPDLSPHLRSRHEVGRILRNSAAEVVEFRASAVIGSGSLSFELVRALVERLPVMVCPRWVRTLAQPIAVRDILTYLTGALDLPVGESRVYEIGGSDLVSYADIMREYARQRGLSRLMVPVPVLTPRLSSLWLALVTPVFARIGRSLIEGVRSPSVVRDEQALSDFAVRPVGLREAIGAALDGEEAEFGKRPISELPCASAAAPGRAPLRIGNRIFDSRAITVPVPPEQAFAPINRIGGPVGWYYGDWLWRLRGLLDMAVGGPGMRRSRRHPEDVGVGDRIDCWRVVAYEPNRRLRLQAKMKLPGRAWLEFEVIGDRRGSTIRQTAVFDPKGLSGLVYWHVLWPLHRRLFRGMLEAIGRAAVVLLPPDGEVQVHQMLD